MAELLVIGFQDNIHRAAGILDELRVLDDEWITELSCAVAVHRGADGTLTMDQSYQPTGTHALDWSSVLGLLIVASLPISLIAASGTAIAEGAMKASILHRLGGANASNDIRESLWMETLGIPEPFFERAGELVRPGNSAIYAICEPSEAGLPTANFQRYGGAILHLSLSMQQLATIRNLLKGFSGHH